MTWRGWVNLLNGRNTVTKAKLRSVWTNGWTLDDYACVTWLDGERRSWHIMCTVQYNLREDLFFEDLSVIAYFTDTAQFNTNHYYYYYSSFLTAFLSMSFREKRRHHLVWLSDMGNLCTSVFPNTHAWEQHERNNTKTQTKKVRREAWVWKEAKRARIKEVPTPITS